MPLNPIVASTDGPRITVSDAIKSPTRIPRRIVNLLNNQFLADSILREGPPVPSGVVQFYETNPLYADLNPDIVEEFGEIPLTGGSVGNISMVRTIERGLGTIVSQRMIDRNDMDRVNQQIAQVRNSMVRSWDGALMTLFMANANVNTMAASAAWSSATPLVRTDLTNASKLIAEAVDAQGSYLAYEPDTLVINATTKYNFLNQTSATELMAVYGGNIADENIKYTGKLPSKILDLNVLVSRQCPAGKAIVLQRGVVGGISDERPLQSTPLYHDRPRESWRTDTTRISAMFLDNPKAATIITGV